MRSQAIRMYKYTKIQGPRFQRNNIIARDQKSDFHFSHRENKPHAHYNTNCIQEKFTTHDHRSFANKDSYFFRPLSSVHLFQSNQVFQAIELVDRHVSEKL